MGIAVVAQLSLTLKLRKDPEVNMSTEIRRHSEAADREVVAGAKPGVVKDRCDEAADGYEFDVVNEGKDKRLEFPNICLLAGWL